MTKKLSTEDGVRYLRECGATCSPRQLSKVLGGQPYHYNVRARNGTLGYDFEWHGRSLRIYTESVIKRLIGG